MSARSPGEVARQWWLDEVGHAGAKHLDPAYVASYDRKARVDPTAELALLTSLGLRSESILVDLGAGTGTLALGAARLCRRVVAVDISAEMIDHARTRAAELALPNVQCVQAGFLSYEHEGPPADFVYSRNALHHLPDFWKAVALARIVAMLAPQGIFRLRDLVYSFEPSEADAVIGPWISAAPSGAADAVTGADLVAHVREEHSTFTWLLEPTLQRAGFTIEAAEYAPSRVFAAYVCRRN
jgi:SAM-dependent methyltransferase